MTRLAPYKKSTRPTFDIIRSYEFYAMLIDDFDEYMETPRSSRRALHCALTTYHLYEWVWGDWLKGDYQVQQTLGLHTILETHAPRLGNKKQAFLAWIKSKEPMFEIIEGLVAGTKHFSHDQNFDTKPLFSWNRSEAGWGQGAWNLLIDLGESNGTISASDLLNVTVQFWLGFFSQYHPASDLPLSKHHPPGDRR